MVTAVKQCLYLDDAACSFDQLHHHPRDQNSTALASTAEPRAAVNHCGLALGAYINISLFYFSSSLFSLFLHHYQHHPTSPLPLHLLLCMGALFFIIISCLLSSWAKRYHYLSLSFDSIIFVFSLDENNSNILSHLARPRTSFVLPVWHFWLDDTTSFWLPTYIAYLSIWAHITQIFDFGKCHFIILYLFAPSLFLRTLPSKQINKIWTFGRLFIHADDRSIHTLPVCTSNLTQISTSTTTLLLY